MTDNAASPVKNVLIYRDRIGAPSEIAFLRRQYLGFRALRPIWTGRVTLPDSEKLNAEILSISAWRGALSRYFGIAPPLPSKDFIPVVHAQFARGGALALPIAQGMRARLVVTLHGGDVGKNKNWRPYTLLARRWPQVIARTHRFVCVSHAVAETAAQRGVPDHKLRVLPIGVEPPDAPPRTPREGGLLFVGRFVEKKGIAVLADAMRRLRAMGDMTPLTCAGDGPLRPLLETLSRDIQGVTLTGWLDQASVASQMDSAKGLVVPSVIAANGDAEGLPSVVPEAMARGCVVIGTQQGGIAEAVKHGQTGILVPPGNAAALAAAMHDLSTAADRGTGLAQKAFRFVLEDLNAVTQSRLLEQMLLDAAVSRE